MLSAAQAVNQPKGTKVKNTFLDLDDSDDECLVSSRRGFVTMPDMPERSFGVGDGFQKQPSPEPSPVAAGEDGSFVQPFEEPSPANNPTLLGALQRKITAELPGQKIVVKNTFIDAQNEPDASPSPTAGHARRLTCPAVWPSMEQGDDGGSPFHIEAAEPEASSDDDGDDSGAPQTHAQRWASMQTEDLRDTLTEAAAAAGHPSEPAGAASRSRASSRGGGRRVSFPKELTSRDLEDSGSDTPRGPRRGGAAFDTQDLRESWLQGNLPELEAGPAGQPQTPSRMPVPLFAAAAAGASPGTAPLPPSPLAYCPVLPPQAFQSPGHGAPQPGTAMLSLLSAVAAGADMAGHAAPPMAPAAPLSPGAVPVSLLQAVNQAGALGSAAPEAAAPASLALAGGPSLPPPGQGFAHSPGAWSLLGPCGYHCGAQMPWGGQWPWYGVPPAVQPSAGLQGPPPTQLVGLGGSGPAPQCREAPPQVQGHAQAAAQAAAQAVAEAARAERGEAPSHVQGLAQAAAQAAATAARAVAAAAGEAPQLEASAEPAQRMTTTRGGRRLRLWAHIYLHMQVPGFDLVPRLIGRKGCNMRRIFEATNAKVRIRGRGSGHKEGDSHTEAPTPLMVAVTTDKGDVQGFRAAVEMVIKDLRGTEQRFEVFCEKQKIRHEGPCFSFGLLPDEARQCLGALCDGIPMATSSRHTEACG